MNAPMPLQIQSTFTRTALYLDLLFRDQVISCATGFVIRPFVDDMPLLVTNWHVVSGRDADTNECLSPNAALPDSIRIHHHSRQSINEREPRLEPLYADVEMTQPRWLEHPRGREIDVVLLPLENFTEPAA